jgi:hypothetical protein
MLVQMARNKAITVTFPRILVWVSFDSRIRFPEGCPWQNLHLQNVGNCNRSSRLNPHPFLCYSQTGMISICTIRLSRQLPIGPHWKQQRSWGTLHSVSSSGGISAMAPLLIARRLAQNARSDGVATKRCCVGDQPSSQTAVAKAQANCAEPSASA